MVIGQQDYIKYRVSECYLGLTWLWAQTCGKQDGAGGRVGKTCGNRDEMDKDRIERLANKTFPKPTPYIESCIQLLS